MFFTFQQYGGLLNALHFSAEPRNTVERLWDILLWAIQWEVWHLLHITPRTNPNEGRDNPIPPRPVLATHTTIMILQEHLNQAWRWIEELERLVVSHSHGVLDELIALLCECTHMMLCSVFFDFFHSLFNSCALLIVWSSSSLMFIWRIWGSLILVLLMAMFLMCLLQSLCLVLHCALKILTQTSSLPQVSHNFLT